MRYGKVKTNKKNVVRKKKEEKIGTGRAFGDNSLITRPSFSLACKGLYFGPNTSS